MERRDQQQLDKALDDIGELKIEMTAIRVELNGLRESVDKDAQESKEYHDRQRQHMEHMEKQFASFTEVMLKTSNNETKLDDHEKRLGKIESNMTKIAGAASVVASLIALGIVKLTNLF